MDFTFQYKRIIRFFNPTSVTTLHKRLKEENFTVGISGIIGYNILFLIGLSLIFSSFTFFLHIGLTPFHFPIAWLISAIVCLYSFNPRKAAIAVLVSTLFIVTLFPICEYLVDYSWDGQWYHEDIINALSLGWNPVYEPEKEGLILWSKYYVHNLELAQANIVTFTGLLETGKAVNLLLYISMGCVFYSQMKRFLPNVAAWKHRVALLLILANPLVIAQLLTYYIDFALYLYVVLIISFTLPYINSKPTTLDQAGLIITILIAIGTKFNHFFYIELYLCAIVGYIYSQQRKFPKQLFTIIVVATIIGFVIIGYHSYITNLLNHGNPLYPLVGEGKKDIMSGNTPAIYDPHNRIYNFFISHFTSHEMEEYLHTDDRIHGFGILSEFIYSISIASVFFTKWNKDNLFWLFMIIFTFFSSMIFKEAWWARYIPQLWLIVPFAFIASFNSKSSVVSICNVSTISLVTISFLYNTATISVGYSLRHAIFRHATIEVYQNKEMIVAGIYSHQQRYLTEKGIKYKIIHLDSIPDRMVKINYFTNNTLPRQPYIIATPDEYQAIHDIADPLIERTAISHYTKLLK